MSLNGLLLLLFRLNDDDDDEDDKEDEDEGDGSKRRLNGLNGDDDGDWNRLNCGKQSTINPIDKIQNKTVTLINDKHFVSIFKDPKIQILN